MFLEKEDILLKRDSEGNLLPLDVELQLLENKPVITVLPLTKGDLQKLFHADENIRKNAEIEIFTTKILKPKFETKDVEFIRADVYGAMTTALLSVSIGLTQEQIKKSSKDTLNDLLQKKNS